MELYSFAWSKQNFDQNKTLYNQLYKTKNHYPCRELCSHVKKVLTTLKSIKYYKKKNLERIISFAQREQN
jgi:hypothetical protein